MLRTAASRQEGAGRKRSHVRPGPSGPQGHDLLLHLQRHAGNRAVTSLLNVQPHAVVQRWGLGDLWDWITKPEKPAEQKSKSQLPESTETDQWTPAEEPIPDYKSPKYGQPRRVKDKDCRLRTGPPEYTNTGHVFPVGTLVWILDEQEGQDGKKYVEAARDQKLPLSCPVAGWTLASNLTKAPKEVEMTTPEAKGPDQLPGLPPMPEIAAETFKSIVKSIESLEQAPLQIESEHKEEMGPLREERVKFLSALRKEIAGLTASALGVDESALAQAKAYLYRRLTPLMPYYNQMANSNMLGTGTAGWKRTCNVTVPAMVLEGVGKTKDDYKGGHDLALLERVFATLDGKYKKRQVYGELAEFQSLRLPEFMTLHAIANRLPDGALDLSDKQFATSLEKARSKAAATTTSHAVMVGLIGAFGATVGEGTYLNYGALEKIGTARRNYTWAKLRGSGMDDEKKAKYKSVDADALLKVDTYRNSVRARVDPLLDAGAQVLVGMENHFVRLDAMAGDKVMVDDPGSGGFKNLSVTWEQARDLGMFKVFWPVTA